MRVYFLGICGTAMGNAAILLKESGHDVLGADVGVYPPMSEVLAKAGIEVQEGFDANRLEAMSPDLVVIGNAMSRGNPEIEWLLNQDKLRYTSLPQLLRETVLQKRKPVVIAGTHGKTTTSTLAAFLLEDAGAAPGWLIGGVPHDLPGGAALGKGEAFVIEGDEYDSAFFDKRSKFIHYKPHIAVINNLEMDHADIFRDLADVQRSFSHFLRLVPSTGWLVVNGDDQNISTLLPVSWTQTLRVGVGPKNDLQIHYFRDEKEGASFDLVWQGELWASVKWPMHGLFNARNAAMAALAAALAGGHSVPTSFSLKALSRFGGVRRRQDVLHDGSGWVILEDFAHHPTAVASAIEALRAAYPERRMTVCFEPRSNTASTRLFQSEFTAAFSGADRVLFGAIHRGDRLAPEHRLDTAAISKMLRNSQVEASAFESNEVLRSTLERILQQESGGLVVFFTNGAFDGLPRATAAMLEA